MKKRLALLGSTGSIGTQTIDVVLHHPEECSITCLAAFGSRAELLARQIETLKPSLVVVYDEGSLDEVYRLARAAWTHDGRASAPRQVFPL